MPASTFRRHNKVEFRNALGLGTRLDMAVIRSRLFLENMFSISEMALSRMLSRDLFIDSDRG